MGLIGLGRLGSVYAQNLARRIPETRLVAVADIAASVAKRIAEEHDVPRWYTDPLDLLADQQVDAVAIVTPTSTHRSLTIASLKRGKPTFCEKPPALSLDDAVAYVRRARGARDRPSTGWASLTPTELAVVRLVLEGLSNPAIGARLLMSRGTVKTHLSHVYTKVGVSNRTELATLASTRAPFAD